MQIEPGFKPVGRRSAVARAGRRWAESSIQDLEDFFENAAVGMHLVGADGCVLKANRAELELLGYSAEEYIGRPISCFHADADVIADILTRLKAGERLDKYAARLRAKDGSIKHVLISSSVQFRRGKFINTRCVTIDVTEAKKAQDALREKEESTRQILDALPAAVYTTDKKGVITYYNPAAVELAGREPVIGKDEWCVTWRILTPDGTYLPHDQCPMAVALKENRAIRGVEAIAERPNGERIPFLPFPTPLRDAAGNLIGAINMLVDISERKEAETNQHLMLDELNHRVKNNLQMIQSLLSASEREAEKAEARAAIGDASRRVSAIAAAQKVLYSNSGATDFNARQFLEAVCQNSQQAFSKDITIEVSATEADLSNQVCLPLALIMNELLTNSVKHGINGSGKGTIHVALNLNDDEWTLTVTDGGPGYSLQPKETKHLSSGVNLILGLVRQLGGTLTVTKSPASSVIIFPARRN